MARHRYELTLNRAVLASLAKTARFLHEQGKIDRLPDIERASDSRPSSRVSGPTPAR